MILHRPDYIGFWKTDGETEETFVPQSVFLMFVEGKNTDDNWKNREMRGDIQDSFGIAYFEGSVVDKHLKFKKYYVELTNHDSPLQPFETMAGIEFEGRKVDEIAFKKQVFEGEWASEDLRNTGEFSLERYAPFSDNINSVVAKEYLKSEIKKLQKEYYESKHVKHGYARKLGALMELIKYERLTLPLD